jgi:hypothetical protein
VRGPEGGDSRSRRPHPIPSEGNRKEDVKRSAQPSGSLSANETYSCPVCSGTLYISWRTGLYTGELEPFYHCFSCEADGLDRDGYNAALREHGVAPWRLKKGDFSQLGEPSGRGRANSQPPEAPSFGSVCGWNERLLYSPEPLAYLMQRRGLSLETLCEYKVGWDGSDLIFPALDGQRVTYVYRRRPIDGAQMMAMGGPRVPYPDLPPHGALCLVAGEIDALSGRQIGLRAVTVCGCSLPDHALPYFAGRTVYLMFDVGEERAAERIAHRLQRVGTRASMVRLAALGLPAKADLNDAVRGGIRACEIRALIREGRRSA